MLTRRDGTQPMIAHGAIYLRAGAREDESRTVAT